MTDFKQAAASASNELFQYIIKHKGDANLYGAAEIITKHYAEIAETFGLLCELARLVKNHIDNHGGSITICSWCDNVNKILANPRIAALLAEKKG